jgi:hypothetical protein
MNQYYKKTQNMININFLVIGALEKLERVQNISEAFNTIE